MIGALRRAWDNFRGSGEAAVTVPPMDGALRPNRLIEEARLLLQVEAPDDLARDGEGLLFSSEGKILRLSKDGNSQLVAEFGSNVTAIAASPNGRIAIALAEGGIVILDRDGSRVVLDRIGKGPVSCITALCFPSERELIVAQGSAERAHTEWKRDLMERRSDGAVWRLALEGGRQTLLATQLGWPLGLSSAQDGRVVVSESWRHRLVAVAEGGPPETVLADLPGYPARIHRDPAGGYWLAVFAPRNQIIEFIQREPAFLARMTSEVDEAYWAAPSLKPSATFLEPLQGGAQKHLGMLKPWAPTRSYGLVVRLDDAFRPVMSYHSRADGTRHGVFTCLPFEGRALAASKGGNAILEIDAGPHGRLSPDVGGA
ncbi:strictosidine synthase [Mesorhizobium sp. 1B3]|uniref:strictosidine synthase n=1 Tax=Mesorhizobium sp. 1B3 TaxID=3243599 RepID=UPI003D980DE5